MPEPMPTGWRWTCACGWGTGTHRGLLAVENLRDGHLRWHAHARAEQERDLQRG